MTDTEFIVAIVAIGSGTVLIMLWMIISIIKWRIKQRGSQQQGESLAMGELEEMVMHASLEANQPLVHRLDRMEQHLRLLQEQQVTPGIRNLPEEEQQAAEKTVGRRVRDT